MSIEYFRNPDDSVARIDTEELEGNFISVTNHGALLQEDATVATYAEYVAYLESLIPPHVDPEE